MRRESGEAARAGSIFASDTRASGTAAAGRKKTVSGTGDASRSAPQPLLMEQESPGAEHLGAPSWQQHESLPNAPRANGSISPASRNRRTRDASRRIPPKIPRRRSIVQVAARAENRAKKPLDFPVLRRIRLALSEPAEGVPSRT